MEPLLGWRIAMGGKGWGLLALGGKRARLLSLLLLLFLPLCPALVEALPCRPPLQFQSMYIISFLHYHLPRLSEVQTPVLARGRFRAPISTMEGWGRGDADRREGCRSQFARAAARHSQPRCHPFTQSQIPA